MATAILTENQQSAVIPFPAKSETVSQVQLGRLALMRRKAEALEAEIAEAESTVRQALENGAAVQCNCPSTGGNGCRDTRLVVEA